MIAKGFTIAFVCLALGVFIGYKGTFWELDRNVSFYFQGKEAGIKEGIQKK